VRSALALAACCAVGWAADDITAPADMSQKHAVEDLTSDNFETFLKEHPTTVVMFYASWCFYSQQMMHPWDLAAQKMLLHDPPIHLAKIDAHRHSAIGMKYGIEGFPTVKLFADDAVIEYEMFSGSGFPQIVKWINEHLDRDHLLKSGDDVEQYLHDNALNVVGLFPDGYDSSGFAKSARHFQDVLFAEARGTAVSTEVAKHLEKHARLTCETILVGASGANKKTASLPRAGMECGNSPMNPQRSEWTDKFKAEVTGTEVSVSRTDDASSGWWQNLQLKCCDSQSAEKKPIEIPVPSIVMFMPHDERFAIFDGDLKDQHAVDTWVMARRQPMISRFTQETAQSIFDDSGPDKRPVVFLISRESSPELEATLREAAKQLRGRAMFCFSGVESQVERRLAELAGMGEDPGPVVTLIEAHSHQERHHIAPKYRLPTQGLTAGAVAAWIGDWERKALTPWLKSEPEPAPEDYATEPVGVLVGTTFKKAVEDDSVDVLVDFYAPWCGHCRKFEPQYKALAKKLAHVKTLKIYKTDATRNEFQGIEISGFPTIMLFPAGSKDKSPVFYRGSREPEDMTKWLQQVCAIKFDPTPPKNAQKRFDPVESGLLDPSEEDL